MSSPSSLPTAQRVPSTGKFVQCSIHNVRRAAACCEMRPVMNADMEVVDYICVCRSDNVCKTAADHSREGARGAIHESNSGGKGSPLSSPAAVVFDASSTRMTAGQQQQQHNDRAHGGASASSTAAAAGDVATLFAVSFHGATPAALTATQGAAQEEGEQQAGENSSAPAHQVNASGDDVESVESEDSMKDDHQPARLQPATTAIASPSTAAAAAAPRARPRYYDAGTNAAGGGGGPRSHPVKVCWNCGMPGHEKPDCPNALCRTCHQRRGPYGTQHRCVPVATPSPFVALPTAAAWEALTSRPEQPGEAAGMSAVRCVACGEMGHFDCSVAVTAPTSGASPSSSPRTIPVGAVPLTTPFTCCYCGVRGHTVFECRQRNQAHPDYFERRNELAAEERGGGGGSGGGSYAPPQQPYQHQQSYQQQQQHQQQQPHGSPRSYGGYGGSSASNARPAGGTRGYDDRGGSGSSIGGGYGARRERTWGAEDEGRRGGGEMGHSRRRYEAPQLRSYGNDQHRDRFQSSNSSGGQENRRHNDYQRDRDRHDNHHHSRSQNNGSNSGSSSGHRGYGGADQRDGRGRSGRQYGGLHEERHNDHHRRDQRSGGGGSRRGGRRDYDSGDDLY